LAETLDTDQWQLPSAAGGWSVRDVVVDMFTFDLTTHLRFDILTPRGPVDRHLPSLGEAQLVPAVSWLLGGIPKMQPDLPHHKDARHGASD
jgi:hypothetical protein